VPGGDLSTQSVSSMTPFIQPKREVMDLPFFWLAGSSGYWIVYVYEINEMSETNPMNDINEMNQEEIQ
jgi:hypothetical protein